MPLVRPRAVGGRDRAHHTRYSDNNALQCDGLKPVGADIPQFPIWVRFARPD